MKSKIKWHRSIEGFVSSHCGNFQIEPRYWGSCSPQGYDLIQHGINKIVVSLNTQKECKERANEL